MEQRPAVLVDRFELDPDVERIDRAAGEEVTDLARAHDHVDANRFAAADDRIHFVQRRDDVRRWREEVLRRAEVHRLFADGKRARGARLGCAVCERVAADGSPAAVRTRPKMSTEIWPSRRKSCDRLELHRVAG